MIIENLGSDGFGYILEVDLKYPSHLHDKHNLYPLAPEKMKVTKSMLSPYLLSLLEKQGINYKSSTEKLVPNLYDKEKYVVHYKTLQLYVQLGLKVKKVHRAIRFVEKAWVKPYVDFNVQKRKEAKNSFEQDLFKLMLNSFYGKSMENVRKRERVELVTERDRLVKLFSKPSFKAFKLFGPKLVAINLKKLQVHLDKPIYTGFVILDLSKLHMYDFHYNFILELFGDNAELCFTDTDSLLYILFAASIFIIMLKYLHLFDTSNYPKDHFLYSEENKKKVGLFKDESGGKPIYQFVGLRPKLYSILLEDDNKKAAKGVKKVVIRKHLRHEQYVNSLFKGKSYSHSMKSIRSFKHDLFTVKSKKVSLCPLDDKRYILSDGVHSLAYGHWRTRNKNN